MADISITATAVIPGSDARIAHGFAGETVTAGQVGYKAAATGLYMKADADSATVEARDGAVIFLNGAAVGQPVAVQSKGLLTLNAVLTANTPYYLSGATAGGICPIADVGTGEYLVQVGIAKSTTVLDVDFKRTGIAN